MGLIWIPLGCGMAGALTFCVLLESWSLSGFLAGMFAGVLLSLIVNPGQEGRRLPRPGLWPFRYFAYLLKSIVLSTLQLIHLILRPAPLAIARLRPQAMEEWQRVLVANSITLTPGTITLEETAEAYTVLCAQPPDRENPRANITAGFEARLPGKGRTG